MLWEILKKLFTLKPNDPAMLLPGAETPEINRFYEAAVVLTVALLIGGVMALAYALTQRREPVSGNFVATLALLPGIISILVLLVSDNIARAFSLAGIFTLIRFRSAPGDPKDLGSVLFCMGVGLAGGLCLMQYASLIAVAFVLVMVVIWVVKGLPFALGRRCLLRIAVPEDMCWEETFEAILRRYGKRVTLKRIRTMEMGSYFELMYELIVPVNGNAKAMIDEVRTYNGNLTVVLSNFADHAYGEAYV